MSPSDRRRLAAATIITVVALPALWLMQRDDTAPGRPSVAAVGAAAPADPEQDTTASTDPAAPAYLEGPSTTAPVAAEPPVVIATGADPGGDRLTGTASFRRFDPGMFPPSACQVTGAPLGASVVVRNVDNDRITTCINVSTMNAEDGEIAVLDTAVFLQIADLVDAPLPVELTW